MRLRLGASDARRAVLEFGLIVAGILTALGVDGCVERRTEAALERDYLQRLSSELEATADALQRSEQLAAHSASFVQRSLSLLSGPPAEGNESHQLATIYSATRGSPPRLPDATYRELLSTGSLRLLRDVEFRAQLVALHAELDWYLNVFSPPYDRDPYRHAVREIIPAQIQDAIRRECPSQQMEPMACDAGLTTALARDVLQQLRSSATVRRTLNRWAAAQDPLITTTRRMRELSEAAQQAAEHALSR